MKKLMASFLAVALAASLAACQTTPVATFADRQVAVLQEAGFTKVDDNYELGLEDRLLFDIDRSEVKPEMITRLASLSRALAGVDILGARLEGHTDSTGTSAHNQRLSYDRANAVRQVLADNGLQATRLTVAALGEADPVASNETSEGRAQNRRVVMIIRPADLLPL
jgi:outer membrane protein OmpA-like peptidoglycan-associated protein